MTRYSTKDEKNQNFIILNPHTQKRLTRQTRTLRFMNRMGNVIFAMTAIKRITCRSGSQ